MNTTRSLFEYVPADDDQVDPEYVLISNPIWTVQDSSAYQGGYNVCESASDETADDDFWMEFHGNFQTLKEAMQECVRLACA